MLISVIIPVYNAENFLEKCLDSVINQSYKNIELILVNDGSADNSGKICNKYALADKRIKVISKYTNSGPAAARNIGIKNSTGNFIFFIDADDFIETDTFEILISKYNQYQADLVMCNFSKLVNGQKVIKQGVAFNPDNKLFIEPEKLLSKLDADNYVRHFLKYPSNHLVSYCWARLYKRSIIMDNDLFANEHMRLFEDYVFNLKYLQHCRSISFVNKNLYVYTMHDSHISASMDILNGDGLLHDMALFEKNTKEYFLKNNNQKISVKTLEKEIGHALAHYIIIFLIRSCRLITNKNKNRIYDETHKIITSAMYGKHLKCYSPLKGNSKILPLLMKMKLVKLIMLVCRYKSYKRYGKPKEVLL